MNEKTNLNFITTNQLRQIKLIYIIIIKKKTILYGIKYNIKPNLASKSNFTSICNNSNLPSFLTNSEIHLYLLI